MTIKEEARNALAAKSMAERDLAQLPLCPPGRHAAFAAVMAALVISPAAPIAMRMSLIAVAFCAIALIVQWDKRRLGVFINGYRKGKTRMVTFPLLVLVMAIYCASLYFAQVRGQKTASIVLAIVAFVVAYVGSVIWQRVFVRELGA